MSEEKRDEIDDFNIAEDYKYSRSTYYNLIEKGNEGLETMMEVARESEHPRAYEVLSNMIKNISDINDRLMDLNKKKKEIKLIGKKEENPKGLTQNNVYIGTTEELQRMLISEGITPDEKVVNPDEDTDG